MRAYFVFPKLNKTKPENNMETVNVPAKARTYKKKRKKEKPIKSNMSK